MEHQEFIQCSQEYKLVQLLWKKKTNLKLSTEVENMQSLRQANLSLCIQPWKLWAYGTLGNKHQKKVNSSIIGIN